MAKFPQKAAARAAQARQAEDERDEDRREEAAERRAEDKAASQPETVPTAEQRRAALKLLDAVGPKTPGDPGIAPSDAALKVFEKAAAEPRPNQPEHAPSLEEWVAAGYKAENYPEKFKKAREAAKPRGAAEAILNPPRHIHEWDRKP